MLAMVGRGAPEPKRSWRAGKTLLARQAHRSENPPASAVGSVKKRFRMKRKHNLTSRLIGSSGALSVATTAAIGRKRRTCAGITHITFAQSKSVA